MNLLDILRGEKIVTLQCIRLQEQSDIVPL
jgi:hypothetical protein